MPQLLSDVQICNLALLDLGLNNITSVNPVDGSVASMRCNQVYEASRDAVLQEHNWRFATVIQQLVAASPILKTMSAITNALPGVITSTAHGLVNGMQVSFSGVVGMTGLNGNTYYVANATANTFTLQLSLNGTMQDVDTTTFGTFVSGSASYTPALIGWANAWIYPTPNSLIMRKIFQDTMDSDPRPIENRTFFDPVASALFIATQYTPAYGEFTLYGTGEATTNATALFVECWHFKMAAMLAKALTGDLSLGEKMMQVYTGLLAKAELADAVEGNVKPYTMHTSKYLNARIDGNPNNTWRDRFGSGSNQPE